MLKTEHFLQVMNFGSGLKLKERTDAEVETSIIWPPDANSQLIEKDPDAGENWGQEEKGTT